MHHKRLWLVVAVIAGMSVGCDDSGDGGRAKSEPTKSAKSTTNAEATPNTTMSTDYVEVEVGDGGTISGTVTLTGEAPDSLYVDTNRNQDVCGAEKEIILVKTGAGGELAEAVVWVSGIGSGKAFANRDGAVDQDDCMYEPRVGAMGFGGKLMIGNSDAVLHNIHGKHDGESIFNLGQAPNAAVIPKKIKRAGPVELVCDVHSWMQGWVFVSPHPYYAVTDSSGAYSIGDVPSGSYTVKTWHEELGEMVASVTVASGKAATHDVAFSR